MLPGCPGRARRRTCRAREVPGRRCGRLPRSDRSQATPPGNTLLGDTASSMELGVYTFAELGAAAREQRMRDLIEEIELADQVGPRRLRRRRASPARLRRLRARGRARRRRGAHETDPADQRGHRPQLRRSRSAYSRSSRRSTCSRAAAPRSWPAAARSSSRFRSSATTSTTTTSCSPRSSSCCSQIRDVRARDVVGQAPRRRSRTSASTRGRSRIRSGLGGGRRHALVGGARRAARPADGARDHRRPAGALRAVRRAVPPRRGRGGPRAGPAAQHQLARLRRRDVASAQPTSSSRPTRR